MIGFSVSIGKVVMASMLLLTSSTTRRASAPRSSSIITVPIPSEGAVNVHGYVHGRRSAPPATSRHLNVAVDRTDYAPVSLAEVLELASRRR